MHYTITATNSGSVAYTGATFTDVLSDVLDDASYDNNAAATAGMRKLHQPQPDLDRQPRGRGHCHHHVLGDREKPRHRDKSLASTITSTTTGSNCACGSTDPQCTSTVTVLVPGLTITLSASPGSTTPGGKVTYTITAKNSGQTDYTGAIITDPLTGLLDDASYGGDATASTGAVSFSSPNLTWTGNLATGATVTVTFLVTVNNPDTGEKLMQNTVTSTAAGSNCAVGSTDSRCTTLVPVLVPGLTIVVTHGASTTTPGATVTYTITVTNSGQTPYTGATFSDALGGVLDDATYNGDAAASTGAVSFTSPNLTWTGDLTVGSAATITFSVTVKNPDTGNDILASTVTSVTPGSNCAGPAAPTHAAAPWSTWPCRTIVEQLRGEHHDARLGGQVHRHLHQLRPGALHRDQGGHRHQRRARRRVPQRGPDGDVGDALAYRHRHLLDREHPGLRDNHRHRHGYRPQPRHREQDPEGHARHHRGRQQRPGGSTDPCCSVSVPVLVPGLSITATASTGAAAPGSTVGYTVTVKNTGQTPYTGATAATFTASLAGMLDDASYRGDAAATSGTVGVRQPEPDLDRGPGPRRLRDHHLLGHGQQPGHRGQDPYRHPRVDDDREQLPGAWPGARLHGHRRGAHARPDHHHDRRCRNRGARPDGHLYRHGDRLRPDPLHRGQPDRRGATVTTTLKLLDDAVYDNDAAPTSGSMSYASPVLT